MVRAVDQLDLDVDDRIPGDDARLERLLDAGVHGGNVFLGNRPTDDLALEQVAGAGVVGLDRDVDVTELAAAAGLTDKTPLDLVDALADGLAAGLVAGRPRWRPR